MSQNRGLQLDRVVLLGRTFGEYSAFFGFQPDELTGRKVLDVASGVSSFTAEASAKGIAAMGCDPIYEWDPDAIEKRCEPDLQAVFNAIGGLTVYKWQKSYESPEQMKVLRRRAYTTFLRDFRANSRTRYLPGLLPDLPFDDDSFDLTLSSYLLFAYQEQFPYEFHRDSVRQLMRVTRGETRIYPMITFEGERSIYVDRLKADPLLAHLRFDEVPTDFEFLVGSNAYLKITHAGVVAAPLQNPN
jgi:hypothetical protein